MRDRLKAMVGIKLKIAKALMSDDQLSMSEIARRMGIAPSPLYRTLPGGRGDVS